MSSSWIQKDLKKISSASLLRHLRRVGSMQGPEIEIDGQRVLNFCSNNYLGLAQDPRVIRAAAQAAKKWGAGTGASRLIAGNLSIFTELEKELAAFKRYPAALIMNSGYQANLGLIPALVGSEDIIFSDELNHASIIDGCRLSGAKVEVYRHIDTTDLEGRLRKISLARRRLIVTESLFSMDGDIAPVRELSSMAWKHNCIFLVDDAHATGVLGRDGRGGLEQAGLRDEPDLVMSTMGKAMGCYGAFVCSSKPLREYLVNQARSFIFSTGPNPGAIGAARKALKIIQTEPARRARLYENIDYLREGLQGMGIPLGPHPVPIFPVVIGDAKDTMKVCEELLKRGVFIQGIRPPSVPEETSRLRITISSEHTRPQVDKLITELKKIL
jgi:8-amino-7-oxononanoate synthase